MAGKIDLFTEHYFPFHFILLGIIGLPSVVFLWPGHTLIAVCVLTVSLLLLSTHYRCSIDLSAKTYSEYVWVLGFRKGRLNVFDQLQYVYVNKCRYEVAYGFVTRIHASGHTYKIFLKTAELKSIYLGSSTRKQKALKRGQRAARQLHIPCHSNFA
jgi:hypothetical protein